MLQDLVETTVRRGISAPQVGAIEHHPVCFHTEARCDAEEALALGESALAMVCEMYPLRHSSGAHEVADPLAQPDEREFGFVARYLGRPLDDVEADAGGFGLDIQREARASAHDPQIADQAGRRLSKGRAVQHRIAKDSVIAQIEARSDAKAEAVIAGGLAGTREDSAISRLNDPERRVLELFQAQSGIAEDPFGIGARGANARRDARLRRGKDPGFGIRQAPPPLPKEFQPLAAFHHRASAPAFFGRQVPGPPTQRTERIPDTVACRAAPEAA